MTNEPMQDGHEVLQQFINQLAPAPCNSWKCCMPPDEKRYVWNDPVFLNGCLSLEMWGEHTSYVECYVTIDWASSCMRFTQQDSKTGAMDQSWNCSIPTEWLERFKKLLWPFLPKDKGPWF